MLGQVAMAATEMHHDDVASPNHPITFCDYLAISWDGRIGLWAFVNCGENESQLVRTKQKERLNGLPFCVPLASQIRHLGFRNSTPPPFTYLRRGHPAILNGKPLQESCKQGQL